MPIIGFKPTKVRLVLEQTRESVVVMRVAAAPGESVELASGGRLEQLSGVLRIREQKGERPLRSRRVIGVLGFVEATSRGEGRAPPRFQIDVALDERKFAALVQMAITNRLPSKFYLQAGERGSPGESRGMRYVMRQRGRVKRWDNQNYRTLPVTSFSMILPIPVQDLEPERWELYDASAWPDEQEHSPEAMSSHDQIAELADELAVFQGETKNTLTAVVAVVAVIGVLLLLINLVLLIR
jgi:hypothetical protein